MFACRAIKVSVITPEVTSVSGGLSCDLHVTGPPEGQQTAPGQAPMNLAHPAG